MRDTQTLKTCLTEEEIEGMIHSTRFLRDKVIVQLLYRTGLRVTELCSLKLNEIDLGSGGLLIRHLKSSPKKICVKCTIQLGRNHAFCPKCGSPVSPGESKVRERRRIIYLDASTLDLVRMYLEKRRNNSDRLIPLCRNSIYLIIKQSARAAGLGGRVILNSVSGKRHFISPHRLRDACASKWIAVDSSLESIKDLQEQLGHRNLDTTMRYLKTDFQKLKDRQEKLWQK